MAKPIILCVDDEKIILDSVKAQLRNSFGDLYKIETAQNPEEAVELLEEMEVDAENVLVVVSDWLMPKMKGDEFLIRVHQRFPRIVKIMLTGQADAEAIERAKADANLHRFLAKPWKEEDLVNTIKSGLALVA